MAQILLVEDDNDIREALAELLAMEGYSVAQSSDGVEAMTYLEVSLEMPKVILLDLMMPNKDGVQFCMEQGLDSRFSQIPTVMMSAASQLDAQTKDLKLSGVLKKPVEIEQLLGLVSKYC